MPEPAATQDASLDEKKLEVDRERLGLERERLSLDQRFLNKHFGVVVTAVVSAAAVLVSATQLFLQIRNQSLEREAQERDRARDRDTQLQLKLEELKVTKQKLALEAADLILRYREVLFTGNGPQRDFAAQIAAYSTPSDLQSVYSKVIQEAAKATGPSAGTVNPPLPAASTAAPPPAVPQVAVRPPLTLTATGTLNASLVIPAAKQPRRVLVQAVATAHVSLGGRMSIQIAADGRDCANTEVYRNPNGEPILAGRATCLVDIAAGVTDTKIVANAPNANADALKIELTALVPQ